MAQDPDVLRLKRGKVAKQLALKSITNGWDKTATARDPEVLKLSGGNVGKWLDFLSGKLSGEPLANFRGA